MLRKLLLVALLGLVPTTLSASDWPTAAHDSARSGRTTDRVPPSYRVRPQLEVSEHLTIDKERNAALRSQGIIAQLVAPSGAVIDGGCAIVSTADEPVNRTILKDHGPRHLRLTVKRNHTRDQYPS
ncbi:MAG TPA: hypothetical protein VM915_14310, partial [Verrucomicrobiae bacterium]|nr:hypothetical protein [Verrucomicrobiae bacterium]